MARNIKHPGITRTADGFRVRVTAVDPHTGMLRALKRTLSGPRATLERAVQLAEELRQDIRSGGRQQPPEEMTLSVYARSWLQRRAPRLRSALTRARYLDALEKHILPDLGPWLIGAIDRVAVEGWLTKPRTKEDGRPYSAETVNGWWRVFKELLEDAVVDLDLPRDPTIKIKPLPTEVRTERNSLTEAELRRFLDIARVEHPQWYAMILLGFAIGARPGELRPLRWDTDLDLETGRLTIQRSQRRSYVGPTKTKRARELVLPADLIAVLRWHRQRLISTRHPGAHSGLVFPSMGKARKPPEVRAANSNATTPPAPGSWAERRAAYYREYRRKQRERRRTARGGPGAGGFVSASALDKPFAEIAKRVGITGRLTPKAMRRTFNDLARKAQVHDLVLRSVTGHRTAEMQDRYSTVASEEKRAGVAKVIGLFGGAVVPSDVEQV